MRRGVDRAGLILAVVAAAVAMLSCGRSPVGGQEGELCAADSDCAPGFICARQACQFLAGRDGAVPRTDGLFFAVFQLQTWTAASQDNQLEQMGDFITDLSDVLFPYYGALAVNEGQLRFGRVDATEQLWVLREVNTITQMAMRRSGTSYLAEQDTLLIPVFYNDDDVAVAFDLPLMDADLRMDLPSLSPGTVGTASLSGALRAVDAELLDVTQGGQMFTLFDVLRNVPLDVDTNLDGVSDAWAMSWAGTAELF